MVTPVLPDLSWREGRSAAESRALAHRTVATLQRLLAAPAAETFLYVAAPNPGAWAAAEARLLAAAGGRGDFAVVVRPRRPNAYATTDEALFAELLPAIIDLGPPELTLLVTADPPPADGLGAAINAMIDGGGTLSRRFAGIHFDSGDALAIL